MDSGSRCKRLQAGLRAAVLTEALYQREDTR